jgi:hypothetical protein
MTAVKREMFCCSIPSYTTTHIKNVVTHDVLPKDIMSEEILEKYI